MFWDFPQVISTKVSFSSSSPSGGQIPGEEKKIASGKSGSILETHATHAPPPARVVAPPPPCRGESRALLRAPRKAAEVLFVVDLALPVLGLQSPPLGIASLPSSCLESALPLIRWLFLCAPQALLSFCSVAALRLIPNWMRFVPSSPATL